MMIRKYILFVGILALVLGLIFKQMVVGEFWPLGLIMLGGTLKLLYIFLEIIYKTYRPGKEILLLVFGLIVFFTGVYMKKSEIEPWWLLEIVGIGMKVVFVVLFILRKRAAKR